MTPALYRLLFPRKGERKERLYYASSKHKKKLSHRQVVLSSFCRRRRPKRKEKRKRKRGPPPLLLLPLVYVKIRIRSQIFGGPLLFGCSFCLFLSRSIILFCVFLCSFFSSSLSLFLCVARVCRDRELDASRPLDSLSSCHQLASPPPFIYINVGIVF